MRPTSLKEMSRSRKAKLGHFVIEFATPGIGHLLKSAGCDFVFLDLEHSGFGLETLRNSVRYFEAAQLPMIVRSPSKDASILARVCDIGAEGIMAPMVNTAEEAKGIVRAVKYAPEGGRGVALGIAHDNFAGNSVPADQRMRNANDRTTLFCLIESQEGAGNADAIAAVDGVDCLWIGHFDLTASLGIPGQFEHPTYLAAVDRIVAAAHKHERALGRLVASVEEGVALYGRGFDFCC